MKDLFSRKKNFHVAGYLFSTLIPVMLSELRPGGQDSTTVERNGPKSILSIGSFGKYSKLAYTQNSSLVS